MELRTELEIEAPPASVWKVLTDFAAYPRWNPFISQIRGQLVPGLTIEMTLSFADGSEAFLRPHLEVVEPERELAWSTRLWWPGVLDERQRFLLEPVAGRTRLVNGRMTTGWAVKWFTKQLTQTARGCVGMNEALKRVVESDT
jgi:hypothetical protein